MDLEDFDQTQAIALDEDYNDDTDELEPDGDKKPVSFLKVLLQKGLNETSYPIYEGDNIIGRNKDTCHVFIHSKSLSKEHACVQVVGDVHMIFDKGSRNKTRRGKLFLSPEVRYELTNNEEVTFADVKCVYQIANKIDTVAESGSDTDGSESLMLKYDVTDDALVAAAQKKDQSKQDDSKNNNDDSVLPPTQSDAHKESTSKVIVKDTPETTKKGSRSIVGEVPMPTLVLSESESSDEEGVNKAPERKNAKPTSPKTCTEVQDTLLCEDSDPESSRDKYQFGAATQAYGINQEDESSRHSLIGAATQAYRPSMMDSDEEVESDKRILCEPTQAFVKSDPVSEDSRENVGTQSFKVKETELSKGHEKNVSKELSASDSSAAATQVFEEEEDNDDFSQAGFFATATMACDDVVEEDDETEDEERDGNSNLLGSDAATQVVDAEAPTQKILAKGKKEIEADTMVVSSSYYAATMPVSSINKNARPSRNRSQRNAAKGDILTTDLPTQMIPAEDETLPIKVVDGDVKNTEIDKETQVFVEETVNIDDVVKAQKGKQKQAKALKESESTTLPVEDIKKSLTTRTSKRTKTSIKKIAPRTEIISDTLILGEDDDCRGGGRDDPTHLFDTDNGQEKVNGLEDADEPTQDYANSSSDLPTQVFPPDASFDSPGKGNIKKSECDRKLPACKLKKSAEVTLSEGDEEEDAGEKPWLASAANEPTQAFGSNDEAATKTCQKVIVNNSTLALTEENDGDDDDAEESEEICENEPTQAYGVLADEEVEHLADEDKEKNVKADEPTQAYCLVAEDSTDEDECDVVKKPDEPTQAYELEPDHGDADATQPFDNDVEENNVDVMQEKTLNQGPMQKYIAAGEVPKITQQNKILGETMEDSDDDSDLEETSVLQMDQVAEAVVESQQLSASVTGDKLNSQGKTIKDKLATDVTGAEFPAEPPLSPEIPDRSCESTPVLAGLGNKKELSDSEEMIPDSMANSDGEEKAESNPIIPLPLPNKSPLKSALVDRRRSPSPAHKKVNFTEPELSSSSNVMEETNGVLRGRLTRNNEKDCKDENKEHEKVETIVHQGTAKLVTKGQRSKRNFEVDEKNKKGLVEDEVVGEKSEGSALSAENDGLKMPPRTSRGRKRKVIEDSGFETYPVSAKSSKNRDSRKSEKTLTLEQSLGNAKDVAKDQIRTNIPKTKASINIDQSANSLDDEKSNEIGNIAKHESIPTVEDTKANKTSKSDRTLTSTPEGRTSSRGRRITTSNHLKDYDIDVKPRGRVSRSSVQSSPAVSAELSEVTAQDRGNSKSSTIGTGGVFHVPKQMQSPAKQQNSTQIEMDKKTVSTSDVSTPRRGGRGKINLKESPDAPLVLPGDAKHNPENDTNVDTDVDTKSNTEQEGGKSRGQNKSSNTNEREDIGKIIEDRDAIGGDNVDNKNSNAVKTNPNKNRAQTSASLSGEMNPENQMVENIVKKKESKTDKNHGTTTEETVSHQRKRGRKSMKSVEDEADIKKTKTSHNMIETETVEDSEMVLEARKSGRRRGKLKASEIADTQQNQSLASAGTEDTTSAQGQKSRRGRYSKGVVASKTEEESSQNYKNVEEKEAENFSEPASTRGQSKDRMPVAGLSNSTAEKHKKISSIDHGTDVQKSHQNLTPRVSKRQKSKPMPAREEEMQENVSKSSPAASENQDQNSQSSSITRSRRGAKRSNLSQASQSEENSQSQMDSSGRESQLLTQSKKQGGKNSKKANNEVQKEASKIQSQPSPSSLKKSRRSSPPTTPSRKSIAAVASPVNSPSLRKSTQNHQPKVMFTGVIDDQGEKDCVEFQIVKDLGGELVSNIQECTHLVTDKVRRTVKFLGGLAKGVLIVTPQWLESSKRASTFLDGNKFLVSDPAMEKQYRFSLQSSLERASSAPLLQGYSVHVTPSVKPDPTQMKDILHCAGAKFLSTMPDKSLPQTVVISCQEDQALWAATAKKGVPIMEAEFILTGLLRQELQPHVFSLIKTDTPQKGKGRGRKA